MGTKPSEPDYLRALFENLDVGVLIATDEARYVDANRAICELLGRSRDTIVGSTVYDIAPESRRAEVRHQWEAFLRDGSQSGVFTVDLPDGSKRALEFHARANFCPGLHSSFLTPAPEHDEPSADSTTITMCAWTKRIKRGERWISLEQYLADVHGLRVTHGISPDAFERFSP